MRRALWMAGLKTGAGFLVIGAVLGIRVVSVTPAPAGLDSAAIDEASASEADGSMDSDARREILDAESVPDPSLVERATSALGANSPAPASARRDGDRMVSCRIQGGTQFMTADDCAMRGGNATLFETDD
jgi:hypothetical protein